MRKPRIITCFLLPIAYILLISCQLCWAKNEANSTNEGFTALSDIFPVDVIAVNVGFTSSTETKLPSKLSADYNDYCNSSSSSHCDLKSLLECRQNRCVCWPDYIYVSAEKKCYRVDLTYQLAVKMAVGAALIILAGLITALSINICQHNRELIFGRGSGAESYFGAGRSRSSSTSSFRMLMSQLQQQDRPPTYDDIFTVTAQDRARWKLPSYEETMATGSAANAEASGGEPIYSEPVYIEATHLGASASSTYLPAVLMAYSEVPYNFGSEPTGSSNLGYNLYDDVTDLQTEMCHSDRQRPSVSTTEQSSSSTNTLTNACDLSIQTTNQSSTSTNSTANC